MIAPLPDADIIGVTASDGASTSMHFERARQDGRIYYRLIYVVNLNGSARRWSGGALTGAAMARQTVAYWRERGWVSDVPTTA